MPGNSFGQFFRITTWGESHGDGVGVAIDGCPAQIPINTEMIQSMLDKRRPGQSAASTTRKEPDKPIIMSGVFEGVTTGTPILIMVKNKDAKSNSYLPFKDIYRPGHGDFTYQAKYGVRDFRGGGRSSARETVARVAAGAVAKALLDKAGVTILAYTAALGGIKIKNRDLDSVYQNEFYCPDMDVVQAMHARVKAVKKAGDSIGGVVEIVISNVPKGLGEPVFDKLDAELAKAMMSVGAVKGVEIGAGFEAATMLGSENNDEIMPSGFATNNAGGILAGISNGDNIIVRAAVKPIPSIALQQKTIDIDNKPQQLTISGRHDVAAIPRINVVLESMAYLVIADHFLRQKIAG